MHLVYRANALTTMCRLCVVCAHASPNAIFDKYNLIGMLILFFFSCTLCVYKSTINWIHFDIAYVYFVLVLFLLLFIFVCSDSLLYAYCFIAIVAAAAAAVALFSQTMSSPFVSVLLLLLVWYWCWCWCWCWWCWDISLARRLVYCHWKIFVWLLCSSSTATFSYNDISF